MSESAYVTKVQAAALCGVSPATIQRHRREQKLPNSRRRQGDGALEVAVADLVAAGLLDPLAAKGDVADLIGRSDADRDLAAVRTELAVARAQVDAMEKAAQRRRRRSRLPPVAHHERQGRLMARPLTGSVRRRGNKWLGSVPHLDASQKRREISFSSEDAARTWIHEQLERRAQGLEPRKPEPVAMPRLESRSTESFRTSMPRAAPSVSSASTRAVSWTRSCTPTPSSSPRSARATAAGSRSTAA